MINKRGEIGTSLTFLALFLITLGIVLGSSVVTDPSRRATTTEASTPADITGNPSWYVGGAPNSRRKRFAAAYWNNLASIADKVAHADGPFNEIESISLRLNTSVGAWAMSSGTIFATLDKTLFASEGEIP